ncbi:hypothetical protein [Blastococcus xanthinilyticus]|uniref:hypothetical protein n=1 Tax=Blastococcus xanthinilyticus TaxID=1564164 RepID=UPI00141373E1|nr:hypothetical protein [Blastococcus xanthinilyticus]
MGALLEAGEQASRASTDAIRQSAQQVGTQWIVDSDALAAACEASGIGDGS